MKLLKKGIFKRLKNIEGKIKGENKKKLESIKNEEQSELLKDESTVTDKKSKEIVLLKDYNNLFFEIDYNSVVESADFLKEIGTFYDLLIYLLDNPTNPITSVHIQSDFFKAITTLKIIISNLKTDITDQSEE